MVHNVIILSYLKHYFVAVHLLVGVCVRAKLRVAKVNISFFSLNQVINIIRKEIIA